MSKVENCPNCRNMGEPCEVCGERTNYCCADCRIDGAGKVYVCFRDACRTAHETRHKPTTPPPDRAPVTEAMVDAALNAYGAALRAGRPHETRMRIAITSALVAREAQKGKGQG